MKEKKLGRGGLKLLKRLEGLSLEVYKDSGGFETVGYGHKMMITEMYENNTITLDFAEELLLDDVKTAEWTVNKRVAVSLEQHEFDALCIFCFNIGITAFSESTLLRKLNEGDSLEVPEEMLRWIYVKGTKTRGLVRRRLATAKLFIN